MTGTDLIGETKRLQLAQPADLQRVELVRLLIGTWREVDDAAAIAVAGDLPIEIGPAFRLDLTSEVTTDLLLGAGPQWTCNGFAPVT